MRDDFLAETDSLTMGDVTDLSNFMGAVIDQRAFAKHAAALERAKADDASITVAAGGTCDDSEGYFVRPTVLSRHGPRERDLHDRVLRADPRRLRLRRRRLRRGHAADGVGVAPYALTGSIFAQDRAAIAEASDFLRFAAGNFYINDKPTGAVVGQQPFGGARASGTNDKAGAPQNLMRWTSHPRRSRRRSRRRRTTATPTWARRHACDRAQASRTIVSRAVA